MKHLVPEEYQLLGKEHLLANDRAALFMGMGLGKTVTVLLAALELFATRQTRGILVLAPLRVATLTWPDEIQGFSQFAHLRYADLRTPEGWAKMERGEADIYLLNYDRLPRLCNWMGTRAELPFDTIVFDESTKLKNAQGKRVKGRKVMVARCARNRRIVDIPGLADWLYRTSKDEAKQVALEAQQRAAIELLGIYTAEVKEEGLNYYLPHFKRRWALTGTPRPNDLMDLFGQIRLLDDGKRLGVSESRFREAYFHPTDYMRYNWVPNEGASDQVNARIADIALTLRTSDFLDIPDATVHDVEVPLPVLARQDYATLEKELLLVLRKTKEEVVAQSAATLVNKLLQITSGAVYLEGGKEWREIHDAKLVALQRLVKKVGEPVLIACNYKHERERILKTLTGAVPWSDAVLKDWSAGKVKAIVADPRSIGHGLNLQHGGRTVIWFSLTWDRELYDQFNGRVIRKNQKRAPQIFRLLSPGTMDDAVLGSLESKGDGQAALMQVLTNFRKLLQSF